MSRGYKYGLCDARNRWLSSRAAAFFSALSVGPKRVRDSIIERQNCPLMRVDPRCVFTLHRLQHLARGARRPVEDRLQLRSNVLPNSRRAFPQATLTLYCAI